MIQIMMYAQPICAMCGHRLQCYARFFVLMIIRVFVCQSPISVVASTAV